MLERQDFGYLYARALVNSSKAANDLILGSQESLSEHVLRATGGKIDIFSSSIANVSVWTYPAPQYDNSSVVIIKTNVDWIQCGELCFKFDSIQTCSNASGAQHNTWIETLPVMRMLAIGALMQAVPATLAVAILAATAHCRAGTMARETHSVYMVLYLLEGFALYGFVWSYAHVPRVGTRENAMSWTNFNRVEFLTLLANETPKIQAILLSFLDQRGGMLVTILFLVILLLYAIWMCLQASRCFATVCSSSGTGPAHSDTT